MISERTIATAPLTALPGIIGDLERLRALAWARLTTPTAATVEPEADKLLTAEQAAPLCGLTVEALRRRRDLPFRRKVGPRTVRYSSRAIERWLRTRTAA